MSDAAPPGPSPGGPDDEPDTGAMAAAPDEPATGLPDGDLVEEATSDDDAAPVPEQLPTQPSTDPPTPEPPTGLPDRTAVTEAEDDAADDAADEASGSGSGEADLAAVVAGIDGARAEIAALRHDLAEARSGVESMLPDLAAAAREETVTVALAELAREGTVAAGNARIQRSLDEMVRLTRRADDHVAELHSENQRLRAGELASATLPMVRDLVRLHDEVTRLAEAAHPEARADLELVGTRLLDTLARWGLTPFAPAVGDPLDATRHQGVGRVPSSEGEPGTIAVVRRHGFTHDDGRTFRPAEVEVHAPPPPPPAPPSEET